MSAWSCPHDLDGICQRVRGARCDPGMRGCELHGKVVFARDELNLPRPPVKAKDEPPRADERVPARPRRRLPF